MGIGVLSSAPTGMEAVIGAMGDVIEFSGTIINAITGNPILLFIFASSLVGIGFKVVRGLRKTAGA